MKTRKLCAVLLVLAMTAFLAVPAFATTAPVGTLEGDSTVTPIILNVVVPTNLDFALDPLQKTGGSTQISKKTYALINKSDFDVAAMFYLTATPANGVTLTKVSGDIESDPTVTDKKLLFGVIGASGITGSDTDFESEGFETNTTATFDPSKTETIVVADTDADNKFRFAFALKKLSDATPDSEVLATANAGLAAFQFYGLIEAYADWKAGDITVSGIYRLLPLAPADFTTVTGSDPTKGKAADSFNMIKPGGFAGTAPAIPYTSAGFITGPGTTAATLSGITFDKSVDTVARNIPFYFDGKTIKSVTVSGTDKMSSFSISGNNLAIATTLWSSAANGAKVYIITLSDDSAYTLNATIQD